MEIRKTISSPSVETVDWLCNICQRSCRQKIATNVDGEAEFNPNYAKLNAYWGYGSPKDNEHHVAHVCESCYDQHIVPLFTIDPNIHSKGVE